MTPATSPATNETGLALAMDLPSSYVVIGKEAPVHFACQEIF